MPDPSRTSVIELAVDPAESRGIEAGHRAHAGQRGALVGGSLGRMCRPMAAALGAEQASHELVHALTIEIDMQPQSGSGQPGDRHTRQAEAN
jgi:hypothetical protein